MFVQHRPELPVGKLSGSIRRSDAPPALTALVQTYVGVLLFVPACFALFGALALMISAIHGS
jgi:hypothetical protein